MKQLLSIPLVIAVFCLCLSGCKSDDYKQALELQESGDFASALAIFENLEDYEDSVARATCCKSMIDATKEFDVAKVLLDGKNTDLNTTLSDAEALIAESPKALDNTLAPALETAISEAKAAGKTAPAMPESPDEIATVVSELNAVDYTAVLANLAERKSALEKSIQQYALVDAPSEAYIIECLLKVPNVLDISAATEDNDPNGHLGKAGWYTAQVYFSCDLLDQTLIYGNTILEKGTDCGGSIEVYSTVEDAEKRNTYLSSFDGTIFSSGSHAVVGTVVVRTSDELKASEQKELESNIIAALTAIEE